ncbi:MAG: CinA family nicotinamide mononucleotide deamidase-related protein [Planctomycetes bacterium]|nr:CinA family nicotinamide mononucleotide deamidase-related protein [Planctomycetota bacterium]
MAPRVPLAEVISVGDELLQGWSVDTNAGEIARALLDLGIRVGRFTSAPDDRALLASALLDSSKRAEFVIITGGLGPTEDDLTREAAADAAGVDLEFVPELWEAVEARWRARGAPAPPSNRRQAYRPRGAVTIPNGRGTAPGFSLRLGQAQLFSLPGVPHEMRAMLSEWVMPHLAAAALQADGYVRRVLKCFGASESSVGERIARWMRRGANPLVGITVSRGILTISVLAQSEGVDPRSKQQIAEATADEIAADLGSLVYAREDRTLEEVVAQRLLEKHVTVAFAESCTAGLATSLLASVPGISSSLLESWVVYSNRAKELRLGVRREILERHGAVSAECAESLAQACRAASGAHLAVSVTGIAGPGGGSAEKPVGTVWFALASSSGTISWQRTLAGLDRNLIREIAAREALNAFRLSVEGHDPRFRPAL